MTILFHKCYFIGSPTCNPQTEYIFGNVCTTCPSGYTCDGTTATPCGMTMYVTNNVCTACPYGHVCDGHNKLSCRDTEFIMNNVCTGCPLGHTCDSNSSTPCLPGEYANNNKCTAFSRCKAGQYISNVGTSTMDTQCAECSSGRFRSVGPDILTNVELEYMVCVAHKICSAGEWTRVEGNSSANTECSSCSLGRYRAQAGYTSNAEIENDVCLVHNKCGSGMYTKTVGTATSNPICESCKTVNYKTLWFSEKNSCDAVCNGRGMTCNQDDFKLVNSRSKLGQIVQSHQINCNYNVHATTIKTYAPYIEGGNCFVNTGAGACPSHPCCDGGSQYNPSYPCGFSRCSGKAFTNAPRICPCRQSIGSGSYGYKAVISNSSTEFDMCTSFKFCQPGQYVSTSGSSTSNPICSPCPMGTIREKGSDSIFMENMASVCLPCPKGYMCDGLSKILCSLTEYILNMVCTACPVGHECDGDQAVACPSNEYVPNNVCTPCPHGHVCNGDKKTSCRTTEYVSNNVCTACPSGNMCDGGKATACESIEYVFNNVCAVCAYGHVCDGDKKTSCATKKYVINNVCTECPGGHTCDGDKKTACLINEHVVENVCVTNVCSCSVGGKGATGVDCYIHNGILCGSCNAGYGYVQSNKSCELCTDSDSQKHPEYNSLNDKSPCGNYTACGQNQKFVYSGISGIDRCVHCAIGKEQILLSHFEPVCTPKPTTTFSAGL